MDPDSSSVTLNNLPEYSPWPARLLGLEPCEQVIRDKAMVLHHFENEKWGPMLKRFRENPDLKLLDAIESCCCGDENALCVEDDHFTIRSEFESNQTFVERVESELEQMLPAPAVVELGAGFGNVILQLARRAKLTTQRWMAAELTKSGAELLAILAEREGLDVETGHCDFNTIPSTDLDIPEGALLFTVHALSFLPRLSAAHIEAFFAYLPQTVVFIEPVYELADPSTLLGLLQRRYLEVNDFNRNLLSVLRKMERIGRIRLKRIHWNFFGCDPLFSSSLIAVEPLERRKKRRD